MFYMGRDGTVDSKLKFNIPSAFFRGETAENCEIKVISCEKAHY
jgi:hypothetical protein